MDALRVALISSAHQRLAYAVFLERRERGVRAEIAQHARPEAAGVDTNAICTYSVGCCHVLRRVADDHDAARFEGDTSGVRLLPLERLFRGLHRLRRRDRRRRRPDEER